VLIQPLAVAFDRGAVYPEAACGLCLGDALLDRLTKREQSTWVAHLFALVFRAAQDAPTGADSRLQFGKERAKLIIDVGASSFVR
jgi:hypothetical protein